MPTNGPNGIEIKIGGDTTPLVAAVEEAKKKVEQAQASPATSGAANQAARDVQQVGDEAERATEKLRQMGQNGERELGPQSKTAEGLKSINKTLSDTVGQVQALFAKLTMVVGVATGFYALGNAIRESLVDALESGTAKAEKFTETIASAKTVENLASVTKKIEEVQGQLAQAMEEAETAMDARLPLSAIVKQNLVNQLEEELKSLRADAKILQADANAAEAKIRRDKAAAKQLEDESRSQAEANRYIELQNARRDASAEYDQQVQKSLDKEAEARERQIQDFKDEMKQLGDEMEKQARRSQQAWESSLRAIREASNAAFNTDNARTMVELAGNLNATATTATANMNRIIVGGTD